MKIGFVLPGFSADERDWCIPALLNLVRVAASDQVVHVFALEYPYRRDVYSVYGATVHSLNGRNRGKRYAPRLWSDTLSAIRTEHRRAPFDVLHGFWANQPGLLALLAGRAFNIPVVVSAAGGELVGLPSIGYG
ncbi:MAG TPA: glycosyltransferase, partial [Anaerolineae bacterium]